MTATTGPRTRQRRGRAIAIAIAAAGLALVALASLDGEAVAGEVRYHASDQRSSWVGVAPLRVEHLVVDLDDIERSELAASVRLAELRSSNALRDLQARRSVFDADAHPDVRFVLRSAQDVTSDADAAAGSAGAVRDLRLIGDLTVRGTSREVVATARLEAGETVRVSATFELSLEAFGLPAPRLLTWVVDDLVRVEVDAVWPRGPDSTATTPPPERPAPGAAATPPAASAARR